MPKTPQPTYKYNFPNYKSFFTPDSLRKKNYDTYHSNFLRCFSKKPGLKNYDTYVSSRKPGPKDGWNGLTLKILNHIAKRNGCSIKELCEVFNIARQNIHYHINKLLKAGLIQRYPPNAKKHNPYIIYILKSCRLETSPFFLNGSSSKKAHALKILQILSIRPQTPKMLREKLQIKERTLRYYINKLSESGLVIRAGGRNCKYAYLILSPKPVFFQHSHKYTKYHRYHKNRRRNSRIILSKRPPVKATYGLTNRSIPLFSWPTGATSVASTGAPAKLSRWPCL
jgi:DNA-binding MarR family transcriptional regulator